jgi:hypothetical protein
MASNFSNGSAYKAMMDKDDSSWKYPGEYGRVSAWVKRTHRDLELEKGIYGHPPSVVFEKRQEKFIHHRRPSRCLTDSRHHPSVTSTSPRQMAHRRPNDTFLSLRPRLHSQAGAAGAGVGNVGGDAGTDRPDHIEIPNPEYITDAVFVRLKKWVHNWILSRIPDRELPAANSLARLRGENSAKMVPVVSNRLLWGTGVRDF